ncbi:hypothetical protein L593_15060 [Salinarchaeum sp. Harcht-Bsk1]|uniref:ArsR/SmtB family transcription factor n=1 Tax=Salinarchaeum sp. Harcht-Bsk1 TaxID=1333523 RepID=UPI000342348D|nr:helix-turn-helix domain-containing protein [Salinarchaeum sp. Harcht-Bsk1]AGN02946.1 hypothetical protein L593_15060 [Salinarchaeum sp. Harcht-Bsk1]
MDQSSFEEAVDPDEAFAVLSDDNRIAILRALWELDEYSASFSDLHDSVDVADSGQFNYHLGKLTDQFVRKTEDGYKLTAAGIRVVGAILGGAYTMAGSMDPVELDEPCPSCDGRWQFRYEDEFARMECESCSMAIQYPVPPGTFVGVAHAEMPARTERYLRTLLEQLRNDVCPYCEGETESRIVVVEEPSDGIEELQSIPLVRYDCTRCAGELTTDVGTPLLADPTIVSFFHDRGVDVRERSLWQFAAFDDEDTSIEASDPYRVTVTFEADGEELVVTVDESMNVLDVEGPGRSTEGAE